MWRASYAQYACHELDAAETRPADTLHAIMLARSELLTTATCLDESSISTFNVVT